MPLLTARLQLGGKAAALMLLLLGWCAQLRAETPAEREYALKAACLFNFCQFITWPADAFDSPSAPIVIGVLGTDPFGAVLDAMVRGESIRGRQIRIIRYRRVDEALNSHLLFISASESARLNFILRAVQGRRIVTIGENDDFLDEGGMIALAAVENRVRLRIKLSAIRGGGVSVSSKLLRVADIVP
ncbi:YfiR family protein [Prosthecobacter sp.]|uniref:YfiR family protein n=1 Tax=Prosthecobacter sp. TaxID=1965333 RepID=UPI002ABAEFC7|nr:YfiR family protein [Prosthecobacter sp.]MDZ4401166.1 YfiR family protein [Prosthecobacter sp.]